MLDLNLALLIIILNVNGLNIPIKGQRLSGWIKSKTQICLSETQFEYKVTNKFKVKGQKNIYLANKNQKKSWHTHINVKLSILRKDYYWMKEENNPLTKRQIL